MLAYSCGGAAHAQADIFSPETLHGVAEVRLAVADGERSWLDGGFGKTAISGGGGWKANAAVSQAALEWRPKLNFAVGAVVTAGVQADVHPMVDIGEAFLTLQAPPTAAGRLSGKVGLFYPPVSMENDGVAWITPDTLSSSAINTWIGEEVKVGGAEATLQTHLGAHRFAATAAVFGWNDTSGTLLSFRGWAIDAVRTGARTEFALPTLSTFMKTKQGQDTYPARELDNRAGWYGRLEWRPPAPVSFNALYYDNRGDRIAVDAERQWAWETKFLNVGLKWEPTETTTVLAQAMTGRTWMGYTMPGGVWLDMGFRSAYVLARREAGREAFTGRLDWFDTTDHTFKTLDDNDEDGWAVTGAWRHRLAPHADLLLEAQHISSQRPARTLVGAAPRQGQTVLQSALRLTF